MRFLISTYLLVKSAAGRKMTWFDMRLARVVTATPTALWFVDADAPDWIKLIAQMEQENPAPEAFGLWQFLIVDDIRQWWRGLWGKS